MCLLLEDSNIELKYASESILTYKVYRCIKPKFDGYYQSPYQNVFFEIDGVLPTVKFGVTGNNYNTRTPYMMVHAGYHSCVNVQDAMSVVSIFIESDSDFFVEKNSESGVDADLPKHVKHYDESDISYVIVEATINKNVPYYKGIWFGTKKEGYVSTDLELGKVLYTYQLATKESV